MKTFLLFFTALLFFTTQLVAQNPLQGTWKLVSGTYTQPEGGKVSTFDHTQLQHMKIITPTHFIFISKQLKNDSIFHAAVGEYRAEGNTYVEMLQSASMKDVEKLKTDYRYKVDGDRFTMKGTVTSTSGGVLAIDEVFERVKTNKAYPDNKAIGTWTLVSSKTTHPDGRQTVVDKSQVKLTRIVTPTHWMQLSEKIHGGSRTFESSSGGTYTMDGENVEAVTEISTAPLNSQNKTQLTFTTNGNNITFFGTVSLPDGKKMQFEDVFEKVKSKSTKAVATTK